MDTHEQEAKAHAQSRLFKALEAIALCDDFSAAEWRRRYPEFSSRYDQELRDTKDRGEARHRALTVMMAEVMVFI
jgi:hypothetical protein